MSTVQHEFLRRYATSPIHVPRLERLLAVYAPPETRDQFAQTYMQWDRACGDAEAARIVAELLAVLVDGQGAMIRFNSAAIMAAIEFVARGSSDEQVARAQLLRTILSEAVPAVDHRMNS